MYSTKLTIVFEAELCCSRYAEVLLNHPSVSKQTTAQTAEVSREKTDIQKSHVFSPHTSITLITPSPGRMGAHQRVKWKCHGGQPWEFRSGQSLSFHMECDGERPALMNKTWSVRAAGTRAVHLPFARLAKAKQ